MHYEITLKYGDTITIHAPSVPPTRVEITKNLVQMEEVEKYDIFKKVFGAIGVSLSDIQRKTRKQEVVMCRMIICHELTKLNVEQKEVRRLLNRDCACIIHYLRTYKDLIKNNDKKLIDIIKQIKYYDSIQ